MQKDFMDENNLKYKFSKNRLDLINNETIQNNDDV